MRIPDVAGLSAYEAALTYAAEGFYLVPTHLRSKNPGAIVGTGWERQSSRDPEQLRQWFYRRELNIALHVGKSGGVVFDIDRPENTPDVLRTEIEQTQPPVQQTRAIEANGLVRGHYLFAQPEGRRIGNSPGKLGKGWGELRGTNGVIIVAPSIHPNAPESFYQWVRTGELPVLGGSVADLLIDTNGEGTATAEEVKAFLAAHTYGVQNAEHYIRGHISRYQTSLDEGSGRHDTAVEIACWAFREAAAGLVSANDVYQQLGRAFVVSVGEDRNAQGEWNQITKFAVARAREANPEVIRMRHPELSLQLSAPAPETMPEFELGAAAYHGVAGDLVRLIAPHGEAHPAGLLVALLTGFGNVVGTQPHLTFGPDKYYTNLFTVLVGRSAKGRKTSAWIRVQKILKQVDPTYFERGRVQSGYGSGQAIVDDVADTQVKIAGMPDKTDRRLLIMEEEFASIIKAAQNKDSKISPILREAWDRTKALQAKARGNKNAGLSGVATEHHISLIAGITTAELVKELDEVQIKNGFGNRTLWVAVHRVGSKPIPTWPTPEEIDPLIERLKDVAEWARGVGEVGMDAAASALWINKYYEELMADDPNGALGQVVSRNSVIVPRLALIYALLDKSVTVQAVHLNAAMTVWAYCRASAAYVWEQKGGTELTGDPKLDRIMAKIRESVPTEGIKRTALRSATTSRSNVALFDPALEKLVGTGEYRIEQTTVNFNTVEIVHPIQTKKKLVVNFTQGDLA